MRFSAITRSAARMVLHIACAGALVASAFTTPPSTLFGSVEAHASESTIAQITQGSVNWGFKTSWRRYIGTPPIISEGASQNEDGTFNWPIQSGTVDTVNKKLILNLGGKIRWYKYCEVENDPTSKCLLDSTLTNLRLELSKNSGEIYATYEGYDRDDMSRFDSLNNLKIAEIHYDEVQYTSDGNNTVIDNLSTYSADNPLYVPGTQFDSMTLTYAGPGFEPEVEKFYAPGERIVKQTGFIPFPTGGLNKSLQLSKERDKAILLTSGGKNVGFSVYDTKSNNVVNSYTYDLKTYDWGLPGPPIDEEDDYRFESQVSGIVYDYADTIYLVVEFILFGDTIEEADANFDGQLVENMTSKHFLFKLSLDTKTGEAPELIREITSDLAEKPSEYYMMTSNDVPLLWVDTDPGLPLRMVGPTDRFSAIMYGINPVDGSLTPIITRENIHPLHTAASTKFSYTVHQPAFSGRNVVLTASYYRKLEVSGNSLSYTIDQYRPTYDSVASCNTTAESEVGGLKFGTCDNKMAIWSGSDFGNNVRVTYLNFPHLRFRDQMGTFFLDEHNLYVSGTESTSTTEFGLARLEVVGTAPQIYVQPQNTETEDGIASLAITPEDGSTIQWQVKAPGESNFRNVDSGTDRTLNVRVDNETTNSQYRAIITKDDLSVSSEIAKVTLKAAPILDSSPAHASAIEGKSAVFQAQFREDTVDTAVWEYLDPNTGIWNEIKSSNGTFAINEADGTFSLAIATHIKMNKAQIRIKGINKFGQTYSHPAVLTVNQTVSEDKTVSDVTLAWNVSELMQKKAHNGASQFFSAGKSDGTQATYATSDGDVKVVVGSADSERVPTWNTRGDHIKNQESQFFRFSGGRGYIKADGSADIQWTGTGSINMYGGLVPFYFSDPRLVVRTDGSATLYATLGGYASSMDDPTVKTLLPDEPNKVLATFQGVALSTDGATTLIPDFGNVIAPKDPKGEAKPQITSTPNWGSWPADLVNFHHKSGLNSYWYTSNPDGSDANEKAPTGIIFDFSKATVSAGLDQADVKEQPAAPEVEKGTTTDPAVKSDESKPKSTANSGSKAPAAAAAATEEFEGGLFNWLFKLAPFALGIATILAIIGSLMPQSLHVFMPI